MFFVKFKKGRGALKYVEQATGSKEKCKKNGWKVNEA